MDRIGESARTDSGGNSNGQRQLTREGMPNSLWSLEDERDWRTLTKGLGSSAAMTLFVEKSLDTFRGGDGPRELRAGGSAHRTWTD
jgi:hypothetical protein